MARKTSCFHSNGTGGENSTELDVLSKSSSSSSSSDHETGQVKLKKELDLTNCIGIIVGIIIGSGIFVSPKGVLQEVGSVGASLLVWVGCGIITLTGALCYAELGTSILQSGGDYAYIKTGFGPLPAFLFLWVAMTLTMPAGNAIGALTLANYALVPFCSDPSETAIRSLAATAVLLLTFINCYNVRLATHVQDSLAGAKVCALALIICAGGYHVANGFFQENLHNESTNNNSNIDKNVNTTTTSTIYSDHSAFKNWINDPWIGMEHDISKIALSFYSGLFSFAGWNYLNFVTEELKDPYRNLPRALYISLPTVTVIYVLVNIAYFSVLSPETVLESPTIAISFGRIVFPPWISWMMPVFVSLSALGGLNGVILASSRLVFVGAREGHLPNFLGMINIHYFTPMPSLVFLCIITMGYLCVSDVYSLINYFAFSEALFVTMSVASLLWLRYKRPEIRRPIKNNILLPIFFFMICTLLVLLPFYSSPSETGIGAAIAVSGIPVYFATIFWERKPKIYQNMIVLITQSIQKLLMSVEEESVEDPDNRERISTSKENGYVLETNTRVSSYTEVILVPIRSLWERVWSV